MKRIILAVVFGVASLSSISTKAQVSLSINIGSQPQWGPSGYNHVDYYYLPDIEAYYHVPDKQYIYMENGRWTRANVLPSRYRNYDLYKGYKVVMNNPKPYLSHRNNVKQYSRYKGGRTTQLVIRDSRKSNDRNYKNNNDKNKKSNDRDQRPDRRSSDTRTARRGK
ncbi:hypothetical protein [Pedobacter sp. BAL39]|uniref:hypothetical protein n=1 Tax=Pedobacter sp. BAL39 TaxID=391596 RepID=UPI0002DB979E|nr:hypothetical protein [Pedobacter sp. BAL39]